MTAIEDRVCNLERSLQAVALNTKEVFTCDEVAAYTGLSKSQIYKLTMRKAIPHYKPSGKYNYFNRVEVEQWMQSNRVSTNEEIGMRAQAYCMRKGGK